jgi:acetyl-CoA acetyltransferase
MHHRLLPPRVFSFVKESTMSDDIVIASAARTPIGGLLGDLSSLAAHQLGAVAIKAAVERAGITADAVDEVLMGCCLMAGQGQAPARQAALGAGLPQSAGAVTLSKMCGSGMRAMMFAHDMLKAGSASVLVAGGMESMSNAPGVNDGASCVVVCSEEFAQRRGLEPLATVVAQGYVADEFAWLARTPANAGAQALEKAGKSIGDVRRVEVNEAFSSVALNSVEMLGADPDATNVNGGAVALGHPIGASGGRIVATMINELRREGGGLGLAAICSGGGQGDALLLEV